MESVVDIRYWIFVHSYPLFGGSPIHTYRRYVLSDQVFLISCCSITCRKLSNQYVFTMAPPAVVTLCVPARLMAMARLYVPHHTHTNRCRRRLCLSVSGCSLCIVNNASDTNGISPTHSHNLVLCHSCLWAHLHSCTLWSTCRGDWSFIFNIYLGHVHELAAHMQKGLVRTSAQMSPVGQHSTYISPRLITSCMKEYLTFTCFVRLVLGQNNHDYMSLLQKFETSEQKEKGKKPDIYLPR